jgi:hypothetical protein
MGKQSGSGINNQDHISESLLTIFWVKIQMQMQIRDPVSGMEIFFGSGINIPDPQH